MVKYDVILEGGRKLLMVGGCFGALNEGMLSHWSLRAGGNDNAARELIEQVNNGLPHSLLRFYPDLNPHWVGREHEYWEDMQTIVNELPWMKDCVVIHRHSSSISVLTGENPADKVILPIFLFRNIAQHTTGLTYQFAKDRGATPLQAAIFSSAVGGGMRNIAGVQRYYINNPGEYNFFNVLTFGVESLDNLVHGTPQWQLPSWNELNGYRREEWFVENGLDIHQLDGGLESRLLIDALSVDRRGQRPLFRRGWYGRNFDPNETEELMQEILEKWPQRQ